MIIGVHAIICSEKAEAAEGVEQDGPVDDERWGRLTSIRIADGTTIGIYQPKHPLAIE